MKKQKENSHEGITWSEMGKQNVQAEKENLNRNFLGLIRPKVSFYKCLGTFCVSKTMTCDLQK